MRRGLTAVFVASVLLVAGCGSSSKGHGATPTTVGIQTTPTANQVELYERAVANSKTGSGVSSLSPDVGLDLGNGICHDLEQGMTPNAVDEQAGQQTDDQFPQQAVVELIIDASFFLCPQYSREVRQAITG